MERQIDLNEVSDGRLYGSEDMVRADCNGCAGCSACCIGMGNSVVLDPYDVWRMTAGLSVSLEELLTDRLELSVIDGVVLPNLRMHEACAFLNFEGRCAIHPYRPGICRLFPLGRLYEEEGFRYFLQVHECKKTARTKVKVKKWIDTPKIRQYDRYITDWHDLLMRMKAAVRADGSGAVAKTVSMYLLQNFYLKPYEKDGDFYEEFYGRLKEAEDFLP